MFKTLSDKVPRDRDYPGRQWRLDLLGRMLDGSIYDVLPHSFHEEKSEAGEYIPLRERRPSVRYGLCRAVVNDSVSLLFSEGHFPAVDCEDEAVRTALADHIKESRLNEIMLEAATRGAVGSVALLMRVLKGRVFWNVMETPFLTPFWNPEAPDELLRVREQYKVRGAALAAKGYRVREPAQDYWFAREWDANAETWFMPWPVRGGNEGRDGDEPPGIIDRSPGRTIEHRLGFVPVVWIRNLPGGDETDGACTFPREAIEDQIEIDYQLSQAGRGLKYSADPLLLIKEPAAPDGAMVRGGGNALVVGSEGDAKLLEINGTAAEAVIAYVKAVRELALESAHGNRADASKLSAAQSGRSMELMNQGLIWLADKLRITYGEGGLLSMLRLVAKASGRMPLTIRGRKVERLDETAPIALKWPNWYPPTADDRQKDAITLRTLRDAGAMSRETAVKTIADTYDIEDVPAELARIGADQEEQLRPPPPAGTTTP